MPQNHVGPRRTLLGLALLLLGACSPDLSVPTDAAVSCATDDDCPDGRLCITGSCEDPSGNRPPTMVVNAIRVLTQEGVEGPGRGTDAFEIEFTVQDPNGDGESGDRLEVSLAAKSGGAGDYQLQHYDGTEFVGPEAEPSALTSLVAESTGTTHTVRWNAASYLSTVDIDIEGTPTPTLVGNDDVWLQLVATDNATSPLSSTPIEIQLVLGNDVPVGTLMPLGPLIADAQPVEFEVTDSQNDVAQVQLEFRLSATDTWRTAQLSLGSTAGLVTAPTEAGEARRHVVVWQSDAPLDDSDPNAPQGVGDRELDTLELRLRAGDRPGPNGFDYWGPWTSLTGLTVDNQSPPRLEGLDPRRLDGLGTSVVVDIRFRLFDPDEDVVDVLFEYSPDDRTTWLPCTEYPSDRSGGRLHLATTNDDGGGIPHVFLWDTTADPRLETTLLWLRATPADAFGMGNSVTVPLVTIPWVSDEGPLQVHQGDYIFNGVFQMSQMYDLAKDGNPDIVSIRDEDCTTSFSGTEDTLHVRKLGGAGGTLEFDPIGIDDPCGNAANGNKSHVNALTMADFDEDGVLDFAIAYGWDSGAPTIDLVVGLGGNDGGGNWDETFGAATFHEGGTDCRDVDAGDLDGDSVLDLVTSCDDGVYLWWGVPDGATPTQGDGTFSGPTVLPMATTVQNTVLADVDGDGALDIVSAASDSDTGGLALRINDGSGGFGGPAVSSVEAEHWDVSSADFNRDGMADIAVTHQGPSKVSVFLGTSSGILSHAMTVVTGANGDMQPRAVEIADMNNDGLLDLVVGMWRRVSEVASMSIHLGVAGPHGGGGSAFSPPISIGEDRGKVDNIVIADFDKDGLLDTLTGHHTNLSSRRTDRTFGTASVLIPPAIHSVPTMSTVQAFPGTTIDAIGRSAIQTGDFDRDGVVDLLVSSLGGTVFAGVGADGIATGEFSAFGDKATFDNSGRKTFPFDFNQDGIVDVLGVPSSGNLGIRYGLDDGGGLWDGTFDVEVVPNTYSLSGHTLAQTGHFNADGFLDVAVHQQCFLRVYESTTDGTGNFTGYADANVNVRLARELRVVDINEDGFDDLVAAGAGDYANCPQPEDTALRYRLNDPMADLTFGSITDIDDTVDYSGVTVGDFNGDGIVDLVGARMGTQALLFWPSNGDTTFGTPVETVHAVSDFLKPGDFDADGVLDLLALDLVYTSSSHVGGSGVPIEINLFRGVPSTVPGEERLGSGQFQAIDNWVTSVDLLYGLWVDELNGDGIPDFVTHGASRENLHGYIQTDLATAWSRPAYYNDVAAAGPAWLVGANILTADVVDHFGREVIPSLVARVVTLEQEALYRTAARALSSTYKVGGDQRLTAVRVSDGGYVDIRKRVEQRFGDRLNPTDPRDYDRLGLDNSTGPAFVFEIPLVEAFTGLIGGGTVVVERHSAQWRTADTYDLDPLFGTPEADRYLPCRVSSETGLCASHVFDPIETVETLTETTDPTFSTLNDDRFFIDLSDPANPVARIWATRLGRFRVFVE